MLQQIFAPIKSEINRFNHSFGEIIHHEHFAIDEILLIISRYKGKQLRPAMVFLSAAIAGKITPLTNTTALVFELLHYSSLIHDDVIDNGQKRHNHPTLNATMGSKTAVLAGDFLLSKCMMLIAQSQNILLLEKISQTAQIMTTGELLQLVEPADTLISEENYLQIVDCKTASLISACFEMGVLSSQTDTKASKQWGEFGRELGIIFQLKDDLLDYLSGDFSQKDAHKDIHEHKFTLPVIAAIRQAPSNEQKPFFDLYKSHQGMSDEIQYLIEKVISYGGIAYTEKMIEAKFENCIAFVKAQKDSMYKDALQALVQFSRERKF